MNNYLKLLFVLTLAGFFFSCNEPDIRLVNQIKTFGPQWSSLGEKLSYADRNLSLMEEKIESNYAELEPIFGQIPDSLRGRKLRSMLGSYRDIVQLRDSLRDAYKDHKKKFTVSVETFNVWERKVMDGKVEMETATAELREFKKEYGRMDAEVTQMQGEMDFIAKEHNSIFRGLTNFLEVPTNYDIVLK